MLYSFLLLGNSLPEIKRFKIRYIYYFKFSVGEKSDHGSAAIKVSARAGTSSKVLIREGLLHAHVVAGRISVFASVVGLRALIRNCWVEVTLVPCHVDLPNWTALSKPYQSKGRVC